MRLLYPKGRAFIMPFNGISDRLHKVFAQYESQAVEDAEAVMYGLLPDNSNFSADDATEWERRLGIYSSSAVALDDRKKAILRKLNHPGTVKARQNYRYIEAQLQAAGFNVKVYENRFPDGLGGFITKTPQEIIGISGALRALYSTSLHYGQVRYGLQYSNKVANFIDELKDATFAIGSNYRSTFYIAGNTVSTFADVPEVRKNEFRQLILQLKPTQTVGLLFVNYN